MAVAARQVYNRAFWDAIRAGTQASAAVMVPLVLDELAGDRDGGPHSVVDVGCGEGWWAQTFADHGCAVVGIDGAYVEGSPLGDRFYAHDLTRSLQPLPEHLAGRFDLAVCLEVAEHLPAARADTLVDDLCALSPVVLFSAAIPGQGGAGHVNEQAPDYWVTRFGDHGYAPSGALRWAVWDNPRVENWYAQNVLLFARYPDRYPNLYDTPLAPPWPVVHPTLFNARRRT